MSTDSEPSIDQDFPVLHIPIPKDKLKAANPALSSSLSRKRPNMFEKFRDPYWKDFTSHYLHIAQEIANRHVINKVVKKLPYAPADNARMKEAWIQITILTKRYNDAVEAKQKVTARTMAMELQKAVTAFQKVETASNSHSANILQRLSAVTSPGYESIINKRKREASVVYALHQVQACNLIFRQEILFEIVDWLGEPSHDQCIFWLNGDAGCGKSVVTYWFAQQCEDKECLAASYRFITTTDPTTLLETFIANLVADFADYLGDPYRHAVASVATTLNLVRTSDDFFTRSLKQQMGKLLLPSFCSLHSTEQKPLLVVLDGLDKCNDFALKALFELIQEAILQLPVCFFISSTPTPLIEGYLRRGPLSKHVRECEIPYYPNPDTNQTPRASTFQSIPTAPPDFEPGTPPLTPLPV